MVEAKHGATEGTVGNYVNCYKLIDVVTEPPVVVVPGDVDGDGLVTTTDVTLLYNILLNDDYTGVVNGDQDGDGSITASDVTVVYNILMGVGAL